MQKTEEVFPRCKNSENKWINVRLLFSKSQPSQPCSSVSSVESPVNFAQSGTKSQTLSDGIQVLPSLHLRKHGLGVGGGLGIGHNPSVTTISSSAMSDWWDWPVPTSPSNTSWIKIELVITKFSNWMSFASL